MNNDKQTNKIRSAVMTLQIFAIDEAEPLKHRKVPDPKKSV